MDLKDFLLEKIAGWKGSYLEDLRAMTHEHLAASIGGSARTAYDFTFETAYVNERIATRLRGEDPGPSPYEGWITAPEDFCSPDAAIARFESSADALIAAAQALPAEKLEAEIPLPDGRTTKALDLLSMSFVHMAYHDGQLNLLQAMNGDSEVHWK